MRAVTGPGRRELETFLRKKAEEGFAQAHAPERQGLHLRMYEYCFDQDELKWVEWMRTIPEYVANPDAAFAQVIVPTADTVRYAYVIDKLLLSDKARAVRGRDRHGEDAQRHG